MQVYFSKIKRDAYNRVVPPTLVLEKPHGEIIGALGHAFGVELELKFIEPSIAKFKYPKVVDGVKTPFYDDIAKDKLVDFDQIGVFVVSDMEGDDDGASCVKEVSLYSLEYELAAKKVLFAEGTYNLWNPADVENTVLGMAMESCRNWKIGYVSPALIGRYRTFDKVDTKVLEFFQGTIQEKYGCLFDFDTYTRTVNVYDADEQAEILPIYLSYVNLLKKGVIKAIDDSIITKLGVYGAEGIDIRNVNPTGDNYLYNLDYYIENGDLPDALASKWRTWQNAIFAKQPYYTSLVSLRNAATARHIAESARLVDLKNQLATLDNQRATFLQMQMKVGKKSDQWQYFQDRLDETGEEYSAIEDKVEAQEAKLEEIQDEIDEHTTNIIAINSELKLSGYFTESELNALDHYFHEDSLTDNTFAVFDYSASGNDSFKSMDNVAIQFNDVTWIDVECDGGHRMAAISGGTATIAGGEDTFEANIVSGTLDHTSGEVVCSLYLGAGTVNDESFPSGNLTCVCKSSYNDDTLLRGMTQHKDTIKSPDGSVSRTAYYYTGDASITATDGAVYFTRNVTEYQRYSVEQDLYDHGEVCLEDLSSPTFEFEIDSGNIVFAKEFEPFRDALRLGGKCYLQLESDLCLTPILNEIHLGFDNPDQFKLIYSSQFKRPDKVNSYKDMVKDAVTLSRTFDNNRFIYGDNNNTTTWVKDLLQIGFNTAMAQIMAGKDNMVTIDQAGIKISSIDGVDTIALNNGMIALIDKRTNTVKMAMGHFLNEATGMDFVGVLADIIGGTLLAGQNLIIECPDPNGGVMQFKVDSSGVIINNGRMYMSSDKGHMGWDANYGFFAGKKDLFVTTDTGYVHPTCVDANGNLILDSDGFPQNVNVWIGIDGKTYIRGNIYAIDGVFNGTVYANGGKFNGIVQASDFLDASGTSMMDNGKWKSDVLDLGNIILDGDTGDITLTGNINLSNGSITWGNNSPVKYEFSTSPDGPWHPEMKPEDKYRHDSTDGGKTWGAAYQFRGTDGADGGSASIPKYITNTIISEGVIEAPVINANDFGIYPNSPSDYTGSFTINGNYIHSNREFEMFAIEYVGAYDIPYSNIYSEASGEIRFGYGYNTLFKFCSRVDFEEADVTGLYLTFS